MQLKQLGLVFAVLVVVAACGRAPEGTGAAPEASAELATLRAPLVDACALLDQPMVRRRMSGSFETHLLLRCGRLSGAPRALSNGAPPTPLAQQGVPNPTPGLPPVPGASNGSTDILVNDPSLDSGGTTQSETTVVARGNVVCAAWNDAGEGFGLNGFSGFGFSLDGGRTFTDGGAFPNGSNDSNGGDPSLAYSARDGRFYYGALSSAGLSMWQSSDDCQSFAYVGPIHQGAGGDDKELLAIDNSPESPHFGRILVGWTDFSLGADANVVSFSDDSGASWSVPSSLPGSGLNGQGMWPAVAPNGDAYVALVNRSFDIGGQQDQWIYKAVDSGTDLAWEKLPDIASQQLLPENAQASQNCGRQALNGDIRNLSSPQIAVAADASAPVGYVIHAIYPYDSDGSGPDNSNVFYRRSVDAGQTWSEELQLNDDGTNTDQFVPALAVDLDGSVVATWYDRRLDPEANLAFDRFVTYSPDGGLTWAENERLSDVSSPVAQTNPNFDSLSTCYHGDYDQVAVSDGVAHVVWSDDRRVTESGPNPDVYYDQIALNPSLGRLNATPNPVSCDGSLQVRLTDADLAGQGTAGVTLAAASGDAESLTLSVTDARPNSFQGSIATAAGTAVPGDGVLQLQAEDAVTLTYLDADTGEGQPEAITLGVGVDCTPPEIGSVSTTLLGGTAARVEVVTSEPASLRIDYGVSCDARPLSAASAGSPLLLSALALNTTYYFSLTATDRSGNTSTSDNGGACYSFTTPASVFFADFEQGLDGFEIDNAAGAGNGLWHLGGSCASVVRGHSRPQALYYGRDETCTYDNGLSNEGAVRSPVISLPSSAGAAVELDYFLGTEGGGFFDQASLSVSVNGGPFQIVESNFSALFVPVELRGMRVRDDAVSSGGSALLENSGAWEHASVELAQVLAGLDAADIQLEFRFATMDPGLNEFAGFYVDDVRVVGSVPPAPCAADADCDDGLFCTGQETCAAGACKPGVPVLCPADADGTDCTVARCDEASSGCVVAADDDLCDDGAFCNGFEICDATAGCQPGVAVVCDDGVDCTLDQCREDIKACGGLPQPELCDDAVFCNGAEVCDVVQGCGPGPLPCDDGVACSEDICIEEQFSCDWVTRDELCDDGLFCDGAELCAAFVGCVVGAPPCLADESCDEAQNQCTLSCVTASNGEHVSAGRARLDQETAYLALGSDDYLGISAEDVTALSGGGSYWEHVDSCSAAPVINSLTVKVVGNVVIASGTASDANGDLEQVIITFDVFGIPLQVPAEGASEFSAVVPGFSPGTYVAFALAYDVAGQVSAPSEPISFEVLFPVAPTIESIEAVEAGGAQEIRGTAIDPNNDITKVIVTVRQGGVVVASGESAASAPYAVRFAGLPSGTYTARAQAVDASGLASAPSVDVSFTVDAASAVQCVTAANTEHQARGRATALLGATFFFAEGSNDFLGLGGALITALAGSGEYWEQVESCDAALPRLPDDHLVQGPVPIDPEGRP
jgi:hypothetical protein